MSLKYSNPKRNILNEWSIENRIKKDIFLLKLKETNYLNSLIKLKYFIRYLIQIYSIFYLRLYSIFFSIFYSILYKILYSIFNLEILIFTWKILWFKWFEYSRVKSDFISS